MQRGNLDDLRALVAVARERSFTKAAAKLGVSQSALSQTIRLLEVGLGVRLLTRTTRSVSPTEAGERLLRTVEPRFEEIDAELATIADLREKPAGTIRITGPSMQYSLCWCRSCRSCCASTRISRSKWWSTSASRTSLQSATTPVSEAASRSRKT